MRSFKHFKEYHCDTRELSTWFLSLDANLSTMNMNMSFLLIKGTVNAAEQMFDSCSGDR